MKLHNLSFILFLMFLIIITPVIMDNKLKQEINTKTDCNIVFTDIGIMRDCKILLSNEMLNNMIFYNELTKGFLMLFGLVIGLLIIGKDIK